MWARMGLWTDFVTPILQPMYVAVITTMCTVLTGTHLISNNVRSVNKVAIKHNAHFNPQK
jgi:hypothetical protein